MRVDAVNHVCDAVPRSFNLVDGAVLNYGAYIYLVKFNFATNFNHPIYNEITVIILFNYYLIYVILVLINTVLL